MACICPLCGNLHDRPAAAPKTASPATPQGEDKHPLSRKAWADFIALGSSPEMIEAATRACLLDREETDIIRRNSARAGTAPSSGAVAEALGDALKKRADWLRDERLCGGDSQHLLAREGECRWLAEQAAKGAGPFAALRQGMENKDA